MERDAAVDRVETVLDAVATGPLPVPVREVWVFGDLALGLDPIERLDLYLAKEVLLGGSPAVDDALAERYGVKGLGTTVDADWARAHPDRIRTNANGYAAPAKCLAAQLVPADEPIHLEVCNAGFRENVTQRLQAGVDRGAYEELLDPRAVCVYREGERSDEAIGKLRDGAYAFPPLAEAFEMLGLESEAAEAAAAEVRTWGDDVEGRSLRADVV
ncbi:MAG: hypothetical protein ACLFMX_05180 [Halobacteriales archaeon]